MKSDESNTAAKKARNKIDKRVQFLSHLRQTFTLQTGATETPNKSEIVPTQKKNKTN